MDVVILSQYYEPEPIPKPHDLATALTARGHRVSVITGCPNYPEGVIYEGYRSSVARSDSIGGIPVVRTYEYPYHGRNALRRMLNYGSFMLSAPLGALRVRRGDVMYVWHPPLTVGVAAWIIARLRGMPFVYDVQDIWPESAVLAGVLRDGILVRFLSKLEKFVYRRADHILVPTEGAREQLIAKGVAPERVTALPHWVDESLFGAEGDPDLRSATRRQLGWDDRFVVLFAGNHGLVQGLETVIEAGRLLAGSGVRIAFVGDGTDKARLVELARRVVPDDTVEFIDRQPMERMPAFMAAADALLVHLRKSELSRSILPSKTMAYLAAGRPILMAMEGAAADLVAQSGAGIVLPPENPRRLADAVRELQSMAEEQRREMGASGERFLRSNLSKAVVIAKYEEILRRTAEARRLAIGGSR